MGLVPNVGDIVSQIIEGIHSIIDEIATDLEQMGSKLVGTDLSKFWGGIFTDISKIFDGLTEVFKSLGDISAYVATIVGYWTKMWLWVSTHLELFAGLGALWGTLFILSYVLTAVKPVPAA